MFITKCHCPHHSESCVHTHLAVYPDAGSVGWPSLERLAQGLMWPSDVVRYDLATPGPDKYRANSKAFIYPVRLLAGLTFVYYS